ncbi:MAG: PEGA domain-containing protein, partial [Lachnospiraceae bacterium]|nr:PEGA domain-containing protein [Lachnospiraceae bacterium]
TKSYTIYLENNKKDETYSFSDLEKESVPTSTSKEEEVKKANISFRVTPADAKVSVDGKPIEEKDLKGTIELTHGTHSLHIEAEGYETIDETITVSKDEQFTYELKKLVSVTFKIEPEDADITKFAVDDEEKKYDEEIELSSGSHKVSIEVTNYQNYNEDVTVDPENPEITISLEEKRSESENSL